MFFLNERSNFEKKPHEISYSNISVSEWSLIFTKGGILATISLEKSKTITAKCYTEACLPQLFENLVSHAPLNSWFLHHNNAHRAFATQEFLEGICIFFLNVFLFLGTNGQNFHVGLKEPNITLFRYIGATPEVTRSKQK